MAQSSVFPGPPQNRAIGDSVLSAGDDHPKFHTAISDLTKWLGEHGAGSSSSDLALDLLLHEIVVQACLATNATGAAIAMVRNGDFVCRATTGQNAPELGSHLSAGAGLSGACIQSHELQRCDDAGIDPRVDADACRELGVRSVLIVPLLKENELLGVFEIFSPSPSAFGDRDVQTLTALSRRIVETMIVPVQAEGEFSATEDSANVWTLLENPASPAPQSETPVTSQLFAGIQKAKTPSRDYWTPVLMVIVVGLSLLLGWMLGHAGWKRVLGLESGAPHIASPSTNADGTTMAPIVSGGNKNESGEGRQPLPAAQKTKSPTFSPGKLTIYESGKVVFEMKPSPRGAHNGVELAAEQSPGERVQVSPAIADAYLIQRVEPHYPDAARQEHIQGAVVLQVAVNRNGSVQEIQAVSGDSHLALAAADAVRQWKFKPYAPNGQALDFETQVTVNFMLP
jgi:TonB family protein